MPTYEYACRDCGEHLEVVQSFRDDPLGVCPNCDGELRKVFSAAPIVFKGSGWHIKDYGRSRSPAASGAGDAANSDTSDTKADQPSGSSSSDSSSSERKSA